MIIHAKHQCYNGYIFNTLEDMSQRFVTDRGTRTDKSIDERTNRFYPSPPHFAKVRGQNSVV